MARGPCQLIADVRRLLTVVDRDRRRPSRAGLLPAIAGVVGDDHAFNARELITHRAMTPPLATALDADRGRLG